MRRILPLFALAVLMYAFSPVLADEERKADDKSHNGKVVSVEGNKLTMTDTAGKEHSHTVAADAKISCNGKVCKLADLRKGTLIRVTTNDAKQVVAIVGRTE